MDFYVVRHAIAEPRVAERTEEDAGRPLTPDGIKRFRAAARGLRSLDIHVETVLASRFARAWSTSEILHDDAGWPAPEACKELEPDADPRDSVAAIALGRSRLSPSSGTNLTFRGSCRSSSRAIRT